MIYKWTKGINNIPILELNNYCISTSKSLIISNEEIVLVEVTI